MHTGCIRQDIDILLLVVRIDHGARLEQCLDQQLWRKDTTLY